MTGTNRKAIGALRRLRAPAVVLGALLCGRLTLDGALLNPFQVEIANGNLELSLWARSRSARWLDARLAIGLGVSSFDLKSWHPFSSLLAQPNTAGGSTWRIPIWPCYVLAGAILMRAKPRIRDQSEFSHAEKKLYHARKLRMKPILCSVPVLMGSLAFGVYITFSFHDEYTIWFSTWFCESQKFPNAGEIWPSLFIIAECAIPKFNSTSGISELYLDCSADGSFYFRMPLWPLYCGTLAYVALFGVRSSNRRFAPDGCSNCGYSLRGNISGRCPECGSGTPGTPSGR